MTQAPSSPVKVLVALADEWREILRQVLEQAGFSVILADSKNEALSAIQAQSPHAVVMISDWALESDKGYEDGLMEHVKGKIPTVSLISRRAWQDARYRFGKKELISRLEKVLEAAGSAIRIGVLITFPFSTLINGRNG